MLMTAFGYLNSRTITTTQTPNLEQTTGFKQTSHRGEGRRTAGRMCQWVSDVVEFTIAARMAHLIVWICPKLRRCFRDFVASVLSQLASFSAQGSSVLELTRLGYLGSLSSDRRCFFTVLRARPVRLEISRMNI
jgi:hypothetical protein